MSEKTPSEPVDGDIREGEFGRESFYAGAWHEQECTCSEGPEGSDNCIYRFPITWPRPAQNPPSPTQPGTPSVGDQDE